jgi:hypothetical protein
MIKKITNKYLYSLYIRKEFSIGKIARIIKIPKSKVFKLFRIYKIRIRTQKEALNLPSVKKRLIGKHPGNFIGYLISGDGYRLVYNPKHPFTNKKGYVREHRLVMEKYLGRYLKPEEVVHHKDGNRLNNKINNLLLFKNHKEHRLYHYNMFNYIIKNNLLENYHKFWENLKL